MPRAAFWAFVSLLPGWLGCGAAKPRPVQPARLEVSPESELPLAPNFRLLVPEDAVVRVVSPHASCSGTLIGEDLVLTSHHCVVEKNAVGAFTRKVAPARTFRIELGGDYLPWGVARVRTIVAPPCGEAGGGGDIAVLVLDKKLTGLPTFSVRLDVPPQLGEEVETIGFGRCATSPDAIHRAGRLGGSINGLAGEAFGVVASVCPGDSGGPVITRHRREVVGVISLSAMDGDVRTREPSVMARVDAYRRVFSHARQIADGAHPGELPPLACE